MKELSPALKFIFLFVLSLPCEIAFSQGFNDRFKYSTIEVGLSNAYFLGNDLPLKTNRTLSPGLIISAHTKQGARISNGIRFSINYPTSKAFGRKDSLSDYTFIYYQTRITKYEFFLMTDLVEHRGKYQKRPDVTPYIYTGIGWIKIKQKMRYGFEDKVTVTSLTNQDYAKRSLVLPIGLGFRFKLSTMIDLSLEVIYNYTFTNQLDLDYLNNFSHSKHRDSFLNVNLKLGYI
jgi:hypothetical protein